MSRPIKLACGCQYSQTHWLVVCAPCAAEHAIIHDRWAADYRAARDKIKTPVDTGKELTS